ncbi:MAG TPA: M20/M25/M40 family metallo-hydrolase, partial [Kribbellaceae bacterium]|nr:M20/M25/M40 family metallo-hydrolase [Kribbellaceae bacterium]
YAEEQFRRDANVLPGVDLVGDGTVADMLWARLAMTVLGIDVPPVVGSAPAIQREVRAKLNLRVPFGVDVDEAWRALKAQLESAAPWHVQVEVECLSRSQPFRAPMNGPSYTALADAMGTVFGRELTTAGQGGSIPTCTAFRETFPDAEIMLVGVEEPRCLIHAPNESVDPGEIERTASALALFLARGAGGATG